MRRLTLFAVLGPWIASTAFTGSSINASDSSAAAAAAPAPAGLTLYSIGDPTAEEQEYLEFINRARRDPAAEASRLQSTTDPVVLANYEFFNVDLELMAQQISSLTSAPPLSMNAQLLAAARRHTADMLANAFQRHEGSDGSTFAIRATEAGYDWQRIAENVFSNARSVEHGHAGFEVDWGGDGTPESGGMQTPPGHRLNIHNPDLREAGIGVLRGTNGTVGPWLVTQDFGTRAGLTPFITGVAFYDLNTNAFYDAGEGVGGITVLAEGTDFYAVTAGSGGYSIPVPGAGTYPVTFQVPNVPEVRTTATVAGGNVKLDHAMKYNAPTISGPDTAFVNQDNAFTFTPVGGAAGYELRRIKRLVQPAVEGAENGLAQITATTSGSYAVIDNEVKASGNSAFHLAHPWSGDPESPPEDQFLVLNRLFRAGPGARLTFARRLGWAGDGQVARAQISLDGGVTWQDLWSQAGSGGAGETSFTNQVASLGAFALREFSVRFVYEFIGGAFFPDADAGVGLYLDDIAVERCEELVDEVISEIPGGGSFAFRPSEAGAFGLKVRPKIGDRPFPWGPMKLVAAEAGAGTTLRFTTFERLADGRLRFRFTVANPQAGVSYRVEGAPAVPGSWAAEPGATVEPGAAPDAFYAIVPGGSEPRRFFRVVADE